MESWVAVSNRRDDGVCILGTFTTDWLAAHACSVDYGDTISLWQYNDITQRWESKHDSSVQYYYQRHSITRLVKEIEAE